MLHILKRIDLLVGIVVVIAGLACLSSVLVLLPWQGLPKEIQDRATVSQALSVALALVVGMIAIIITAGIEKSEYRAQERLNSDIASLGSALSSIYLKITPFRLPRHLPVERPNFERELKTIGEFVCSTSGFALLCWAADKSEQTGKGRSELWRYFFYDLVSWQMRTGNELIEFVLDTRPDSASVDPHLSSLGSSHTRI